VARKSYRVQFSGGSGFPLAGIVDRPNDVDAFPVAVFTHCFTCNKDLKAIVRISRGLAELGIGVLRFDMTGLGGSDGDFAETNFTTNLADLNTAIGFANQDLGPVTTLIGHSFGGAASLAIAGSNLVENLGAVVTLAAPSDTSHLATLLTKMNPAIESAGSGTVTIGGVDWKINAQMLADFRNHDLPGLIANINCPTLLMHSPDDQTLGFDHVLRIMGLIQVAPEKTTPVSVVSLDGADHLLANTQADLDFVIPIAAAFVNRYARPRN
jgi:pimeloyl-ACP methyl ester carboxylesterase